MISTIFIICGLLTALAAVDAIRRPHVQWVEVDRDKSFWSTWLVIGAFLGPIGLVFASIYAIRILPMFTEVGRHGHSFQKSATATDQSAIASAVPGMRPNDSEPCLQCGAPQPMSARFCGECGTQISEDD